MNPIPRLLVIFLVVLNLLLLAWHLSTPPEADVDVTATVQAPPIPAGTPGIALLREMPPPPEQTGQPALCFAVGPFETIASREQARELLLPVADAIFDRESEALVELGYWVTLPPFEDFATAGAAMRSLNQAGLQDTAVVSGATGDYRVSLGYFLDQANARRRRDHARSLGFDADIQLQRETQPRYWLDYERGLPTGSAGNLPPDGIPAAQHRAIPCAAGLDGSVNAGQGVETAEPAQDGLY